MSLKEMGFYAKGFSYFPDFILEKITQRFQKLHFHIIRKSAYVMMAFDDVSSAVSAFYYIRVYSSLY